MDESDCLDRSIGPFRLGMVISCQGGGGSYVSIDRVRLAPHSPDLPVWADHFEHPNASILQILGYTYAVGVGALDANVSNDAERSDIGGDRLISDQRDVGNPASPSSRPIASITAT